MSHISRDLFKAIHEGKWLSIEYQNQKKELTRFLLQHHVCHASCHYYNGLNI